MVVLLPLPASCPAAAALATPDLLRLAPGPAPGEASFDGFGSGRECQKVTSGSLSTITSPWGWNRRSPSLPHVHSVYKCGCVCGCVCGHEQHLRL